MSVDASAPRLADLFARYEQERASGLAGVPWPRLTIEQRMNAENIVSALHAEGARGDDQVALYLRYLAPILAESPEAVTALRRSLETLRPSPPPLPPTWWEKLLQAVGKWRIRGPRIVLPPPRRLAAWAAAHGGGRVGRPALSVSSAEPDC
jgi:hypothetical protein